MKRQNIRNEEQMKACVANEEDRQKGVDDHRRNRFNQTSSHRVSHVCCVAMRQTPSVDGQTWTKLSLISSSGLDALTNAWSIICFRH